ncbi:MAG: polyprenyl synthetase family protein [Gemmataceae bacterium]|nr:polyprenyl synthetase family protein [Gemmataceae bacterium]
MNVSLATPAFTTAPLTDSWISIRAELDEVERILERALRPNRPEFASLLHHVGKFRGKRLRPALLLASAKACGEITANHFTLAAAVELIHTATLVHDDVLDGAKVRRHLSAVHILWGVKPAVLLGDCLFTQGFTMATEMDDLRACQVLGRAANQVCAGELLQELKSGDLNLDEETYFEIIEGKTAEILAVSCEIGSTYAGACKEWVKALRQYGKYCGLAFQIADDILDITGLENHTGKSLGTDLRQLKLTLPIIWLLREGPQKEAARMREMLQNPGENKGEMARDCLQAAGAFDYAKNRAEELIQAARRELHCLPPSPYKTLLLDTATQTLNRSS